MVNVLQIYQCLLIVFHMEGLVSILQVRGLVIVLQVSDDANKTRRLCVCIPGVNITGWNVFSCCVRFRYYSDQNNKTRLD